MPINPTQSSSRYAYQKASWLVPAKWQAKYSAGGASALTTSGRPRPVPMPLPEASATECGNDAARAQRRITELERKVGQQALELDFFRAALQRVREQRQPAGAPGETASTQ
jgi:transposase